MVRVRLAPSPTGKLHLGTARTALFNFLFAQKNKGKFILRIEDTDRSRSTKEFEKDIIEGLKWLGLNWDEFYRQTERLSIYQRYAQQLLKEQKAYYCYCQPEELERERKEQERKKLPTKYSGRCRNLTPKQVEQFEREGRKKAIRFKVEPQIIKLNDLIHGELVFDTALEGDFIILKSDGFPIFHFAVVVDDYEMEISHIIRGEDHLSNTPRQILLQRALRFPTPLYAHIPLILNPDRTKMSKRYTAVEVSEYKKMGYLPEALVNYLALLGLSGSEQEVIDIRQLIQKFEINRIQKSPAIFYKEKLDWLNGEWIRRLKTEELQQRILDFGYKEVNKAMVQIIQERIKRLDEVSFWTDFFFKEPKYDQKQLTKVLGPEESKRILEMLLSGFEKRVWKSDIIKKEVAEIAERVGLKLKEMLYPVRIAITGSAVSPPLFDSMEILGKEKCLTRLQRAIQLLERGVSCKE